MNEKATSSATESRSTLTGNAHLEFMGGDTVEQVYNRVSRERQSLEDARDGDNSPDSVNERHSYLCEVEQACETIIGFMNGEYREFKEQQEGGAS